MLCSKLHCQKFFKLKLFSYKIARTVLACDSARQTGSHLRFDPGDRIEFDSIQTGSNRMRFDCSARARMSFDSFVCYTSVVDFMLW